MPYVSSLYEINISYPYRIQLTIYTKTANKEKKFLIINIHNRNKKLSSFFFLMFDFETYMKRKLIWCICQIHFYILRLISLSIMQIYVSPRSTQNWLCGWHMLALILSLLISFPFLFEFNSIIILFFLYIQLIKWRIWCMIFGNSLFFSFRACFEIWMKIWIPPLQRFSVFYF